MTTATAQTATLDPHVIANPTYTFLPMDIDVDRPAAEVWARVGGYCDIGEWFGMGCTMVSGVEGEFGSVRSVANEVLVGRTELSYTYTQTPREGRPYDLYHGTLEARPVTAEALKAAQPELMRAAQKGVVHKNTASRKMSRLSKRVAAL